MIKVGFKVSVGGFLGCMLMSELGELCFVWDCYCLVVLMMVNMIFNLLFFILVDDKIFDKKKNWEVEFVFVEEWSGMFESLGKIWYVKVMFS